MRGLGGSCLCQNRGRENSAWAGAPGAAPAPCLAERRAGRRVTRLFLESVTLSRLQKGAGTNLVESGFIRGIL